MAEGCAVMLFYQVGELFQSYAVGKIAQIHRSHDGHRARLRQRRARRRACSRSIPTRWPSATSSWSSPARRMPTRRRRASKAACQLDTAALTGESVPRACRGRRRACYQRLREPDRPSARSHHRSPSASPPSAASLSWWKTPREKKATHGELHHPLRPRTTPPPSSALALLLAIIPPLSGHGRLEPIWILRGLTFLVVSCPCALVISVPLSLLRRHRRRVSKLGILVKGSNYLEALGQGGHRGVRQDRHADQRHLQAWWRCIPSTTSTTDYLLSYAAHAECLLRPSHRAVGQGSIFRHDRPGTHPSTFSEERGPWRGGRDRRACGAGGQRQAHERERHGLP